MFSPLARGKAGWDGDLQCEEYSHQTVRRKLLFSFWIDTGHDDDMFDTRGPNSLELLVVAINNNFTQKSILPGLSIILSMLTIS